MKLFALVGLVLLNLLIFIPVSNSKAQVEYVILVTNDLGMHCMNKDHANMSILPPYNTLNAQVIFRGNRDRLPEVVTTGITLEYSIPGNTYSVGKTDFWDHDVALFGVDLPPNVGLTGKGLTGEFDVQGDMFLAEGIPLTPFTDAEPNLEDPYQQALVILRDNSGVEVSRARPVMPVSTEVTCVSSGCHSSEMGILNQHTTDDGFSPNNRPILCASCHSSPPLTGPAPGSEGYFSQVIHDKHSFIDESIPGIDGCFKCHPGEISQCLRGTMSQDFGMVCQDCHGDLDQVASSIDDGRIPWFDEPSCRSCHTSNFGEPVGELYRNARGHGGVMCSGCHNSPHAVFPSREERDNQVMVDLQGHSGTLSDCTVCHGYSPSGPGPHGTMAISAVEEEILDRNVGLRIFPAPFHAGGKVTIMAASSRPAEGRLLVFDARGRTVRLLHGEEASEGQARVFWDGRDGSGRRVSSGVYFMRWDEGQKSVSGKLVVIN